MPELTLSVPATLLDFAPEDEGARRTLGFRGRFPSVPGLAEERVAVYVETAGEPCLYVELGEARRRRVYVSLREIAAAVREAEAGAGDTKLPAAFFA